MIQSKFFLMLSFNVKQIIVKKIHEYRLNFLNVYQIIYGLIKSYNMKIRILIYMIKNILFANNYLIISYIL
jgi:hypothetical protein